MIRTQMDNSIGDILEKFDSVRLAVLKISGAGITGSYQYIDPAFDLFVEVFRVHWSYRHCFLLL